MKKHLLIWEKFCNVKESGVFSIYCAIESVIEFFESDYVYPHRRHFIRG